MKKIKNIDSVTHTWCGLEITAGTTQSISDEEGRALGNDSQFLVDLAAEKAEVYNNDTLVSDYNTAISLLRDDMVSFNEPKDTEGRLYTRDVVTQPEFHYSPRSFDFYTSKYKSLYNRSHLCADNNTTDGGTIDGSVDLGDGFLKFFDATNTELVKGAEESDSDFQIRLTANCTKSVMEFEPSFAYDVFGAKLQIRNPPSDRAYFWFVAAPDVPVAYGGNVTFMGGGMNLSFFGDKDTFTCDGKTVSRVTPDAVYHSGKLALIVKHSVGVQIGIQLILQFYSA